MAIFHNLPPPAQVGGRQPYEGRKLPVPLLVPPVVVTPDNPPGARVPTFIAIDDPQPQQRLLYVVQEFVAPVVETFVPYRRQQLWSYDTPPNPQQMREMNPDLLGAGEVQAPAAVPAKRPQQIWSYDTPLNPQQLRGMGPQLLKGALQEQAPPPLRPQQLWPYDAAPYPQQRRVLQTVSFTPAVQADTPPPIKRHPVWGWGPTEPIWAPAKGPVTPTPDNPGPPNLWFNTVYKAWEPPYIPPQQKLVNVRLEPPAETPFVQNQDPPSLARVPTFYEIPDPQPQQRRPLQTISGPAAAPADNPPLLARYQPPQVFWEPPTPVSIVRSVVEFGDAAAQQVDNPPLTKGPWQYRVLLAWQQPDPLPQQRIINVRAEAGIAPQQVDNPPLTRPQPNLTFWKQPDPVQQAQIKIVQPGIPQPEPQPEEPAGAGGIWVPHSFTRKRCRELLEEIARERAAAQALAEAPKKAVLAAAKATAAAVRDACDLCPAEASGEFYAEARDVVASLHRLMEADLQAKVLIARAKEVERQAIALRRAAEEADDDDAISILLMGM